MEKPKKGEDGTIQDSDYTEPEGKGEGEEVTSIDWKNDPRISYDQVKGKWIFEDPDIDDGAEYEYSEEQRRWVPVIDEKEMEEQQAAYKDATNSETTDSHITKEEDTDIKTSITGLEKRKTREEDNDDKKVIDSIEDNPFFSNSNDNNNKRQKKQKSNNNRSGTGNDTKQQVKRTPQNKGIYITQLPKDTNEEEVEQVFSKFGIIAEDMRGTGKREPGTSTKRIKLYKETSTEAGKSQLKGDALVIYFKPESVNLAIQMMDGAEFRVGDKSSIIRVEAAQFPGNKNNGDNEKLLSSSTISKNNENIDDDSTTNNKNNDELKDQDYQSRKKEKLRLQKKYQKLNEYVMYSIVTKDIKIQLKGFSILKKIKII